MRDIVTMKRTSWRNIAKKAVDSAPFVSPETFYPHFCSSSIQVDAPIPNLE